MATQIRIKTDGTAIAVYDDRFLPIFEALGITINVKRQSEVEFETATGEWVARFLATGEVIGRSRLRSEAIAQEVEWLETNFVLAKTHPTLTSAITYADLLRYPGYRVSSDGKVWSRWANSGQVRESEWRECAPARNGRYPTVTLRIAKRRRHTCAVHILLLETFVGPCPPGMEARHLNSNAQDCSLSNLCWGTKQENMADRELLGRVRSNLTIPQIREIRERAKHGATIVQLAEEFRVTARVVDGIVHRRTWRNI